MKKYVQLNVKMYPWKHFVVLESKNALYNNKRL